MIEKIINPTVSQFVSVLTKSWKQLYRCSVLYLVPTGSGNNQPVSRENYQPYNYQPYSYLP